MTISFYFAIGAQYRFSNLDVALATGQCHFLVPAGSLAARRLRDIPNIRVASEHFQIQPHKCNSISK